MSNQELIEKLCRNTKTRGGYWVDQLKPETIFGEQRITGRIQLPDDIDMSYGAVWSITGRFISVRLDKTWKGNDYDLTIN